jgi:hypothetical protein
MLTEPCGGMSLRAWGPGSANGSAAGRAVAKTAKTATSGVEKCMVVWYGCVCSELGVRIGRRELLFNGVVLKQGGRPAL